MQSMSYTCGQFEPLPDESLFSIVCRYHKRSGSTYFFMTRNKIFGCDIRKKIKGNIDYFLKGIRLDTVSSKIEYLRKTTLISYRFRESDSEMCCYSELKHKRNFSLLVHYMLTSDARQRFCIDCLKDDIYRYGVSYWHRAHMLKHIKLCHIHGTILWEPNTLGYIGVMELSSVVMLPSDYIAIHDGAVQINMDQSTKNMEMEKRIADRIFKVYCN